jgi:hypothetical protein
MKAWQTMGNNEYSHAFTGSSLRARGSSLGRKDAPLGDQPVTRSVSQTAGAMRYLADRCLARHPCSYPFRLQRSRIRQYRPRFVTNGCRGRRLWCVQFLPNGFESIGCSLISCGERVTPLVVAAQARHPQPLMTECRVKRAFACLHRAPGRAGRRHADVLTHHRNCGWVESVAFDDSVCVDDGRLWLVRRETSHAERGHGQRRYVVAPVLAS